VEGRGGGLTVSGVSRNCGGFVKCVAIQKRLGIPGLEPQDQIPSIGYDYFSLSRHVTPSLTTGGSVLYKKSWVFVKSMHLHIANYICNNTKFTILFYVPYIHGLSVQQHNMPYLGKLKQCRQLSHLNGYDTRV
jgi:hypothetical protein